MPETRLPYLHIFTDRHGGTRFYYRRHGKRTSLRGPFGSADFIADYAAAQAKAEGATIDTPKPVDRVKPGTYAALIRDYLASSEFAEKAATTQAEYSRVLRIIEAEDGHRLPRDLRRKDVRKRRDARADTPGAANTYLGILSMLQGWAVEAEWDTGLEVNVCKGVRKMKLGAYRSWTVAEKEAFEIHWPIGSKQRLGYALARYTGQRRSDLVAMTRGQLAAGAIALRQQKTDTPLWIPIHRDLRAAIDGMDETSRGHLLLLTNANGAGFNEVYFGAWFASAIDEAGLSDDCVLHGLRHSSGSDMADAGASEKEIAAILGHKTLQMVQKYTKGAEQKRLAKSAIEMLEKAQR